MVDLGQIQQVRNLLKETETLAIMITTCTGYCEMAQQWIQYHHAHASAEVRVGSLRHHLPFKLFAVIRTGLEASSSIINKILSAKIMQISFPPKLFDENLMLSYLCAPPKLVNGSTCYQSLTYSI